MAVDRWRPFMTLERWEPFSNTSEIQGEMNRLFDSFFGRPTSVATAEGARVWPPVFDMYETKDELVLKVELPGVREKDISLSINVDPLTAKGERALVQDQQLQN